MSPGRAFGAWLVAVGLAAALLAPAPGHAQAPPTELPREAVEEIVRDYLRRHPEVVIEAIQAFEERRRAEARERASRVVAERRDALVRDPASPAAGNPQGDVTVVQFFDYQCRYCKSVAGAVRTLLAEDRSVRLVYKELPVLGPDSTVAAQAALAANAQGRYVAFHDALMALEGRPTLEAIRRVARQVGLDAARLEREMKAPAIQAALRANQALAREIGITGTPAFVIGAEVVPGAVPLERLRELVARARAR